MTHTTHTSSATVGGTRFDPSPVALTVNGERRAMAAGSTVGDLLAAHALDPRLVVVERNGEIMRDREALVAVPLTDGDVLELVHFVGGG